MVLSIGNTWQTSLPTWAGMDASTHTAISTGFTTFAIRGIQPPLFKRCQMMRIGFWRLAPFFCRARPYAAWGTCLDDHPALAGQHLGGQSGHRGLRREVSDECRHRRSPPGRRLDASQSLPCLENTRFHPGRMVPTRQPEQANGSGRSEIILRPFG